ncbi:carbohydrate kinase [Paracoccus sp. P2]|uniref:Carbohydrate kinase n=1 Tax=Paracoccus pantotrophus TaxID=82367 RepID=A0A7H9BNP9_PARPN|nr:carbohydrate kinase [Paracoccus pantotrophus]MDF3855903.1 carbohydrate kinase [Paracoccus pantotrophus]QLH12937.1 carbohydrate kinase [Paracoccus pantotrophus]RDD96730.1 carbohydrate kinase [Paracoccus pantotrophus]RNI14681.1 carbohydrate kinase [Paracoccus pantotrophus]WGR66548.1 carbohydrate kinase [Paracoccus pantotrophus]
MILCAGESLIDMVPEGANYRPLPGGAVYNTAIALGRMGAQTGYLWPISRDTFGETLLRPLAEAGVDTGLCPRSDRLTTLAFVTLTGGEARYSFYDEGSAGRMFAPEDLPEIPDTVSALFIGGISLVPDPCGAAVEALVERVRHRVPVMLDPNIRPFFIADETAYRARLDRLIAMADLVKLSGDDLEWLMPGASFEEAAAAILSRGPRVVFQTGGSAGARARWSGAPLSARAVRVEVADTIGAGDTFNAGVLAALDRAGVLTRQGLETLAPESIAQALALGTSAAAITVSRPGADPPWAHELAALPG